MRIEKHKKRADMRKEAEAALERGKNYRDAMIANSLKEDEVTYTLVLPNQQFICSPAYKKFLYGIDFREVKMIAQGGMGVVYLGHILEQELITNYNNGDKLVVIKMSKNSKLSDSSRKLFLQELSIHELFKGNKYFASLVCFSENPYCLVLKYYEHGSLNTFLFSKGKKFIEYDIKTALGMAGRLSYAFKVMHIKGIIHNDIKLDNILLDKDNEEPVFPVVTDFGICTVLNDVDVIKGFEIAKINGATPSYCSPEVLVRLTTFELAL